MKQQDLAGKTHWDSIYEGAPGSAESWEPSTYEELALAQMLGRAAAAAEAKSILEVGCGSSVWLPYLARTASARVAGLDYSREGCEAARARLRAAGVTGEVFCEDLFSEAADRIGQYDLVYSLGVVEHFADLADVVGKIARFVRSGGVLFTEVPNLRSVHGLLTWLYQPELLAKHVLVTRRQLERAHRAAGLTVVESGFKGVASLNITSWGRYARWPAVDRYVVGVVRRVSRAFDQALRWQGRYEGAQLLAPYLYVLARR